MYAIALNGCWLLKVNRTKVGRIRCVVWTAVATNARKYRLRLMAVAQLAELHRECSISARIVRYPKPNDEAPI